MRFDYYGKMECYIFPCIVSRFVDYQGLRYTSACVDLTYYMYLSIQPPVRRANYSHLIKCYHDSLVESLDKFGYGGPKPNLEDFTSSMDRMSLFGKTKLVSDYGFLMCPPEEAADMNEILTTNGESGYNFQVLKNPGMAGKFGPEVMAFLEALSM